MSIRRIFLLPALIFSSVVPMGAQTGAPWQTGTYVYDGAGNIKSIGAEQYRYDALGRMKTGTITTGQTQTAMYDPYGNITSLTTNGTELIFGVDGNTNRLTETQSNVYGTYDNAGRLISALNGTGGSFVYDDLDMVKKTTVDGLTKVHVYTASDERILSIATGNNAEEWTLRDPSNRVLRRLQRVGAQWTWKEDDIYAAGQLIAAEVDTPAQTLHFFSDHLGTPRLITSNGGTKVAFHTYYPFGAEATSPSQDGEKLKFTGHERDAASLDYMHARYYAPLWGRFLSPDRVRNDRWNVPQAWNRYAYVLNNPLTRLDPNGMKDTVYWLQSYNYRDVRGVDGVVQAAVAAHKYDVRVTYYASREEILSTLAKSEETDIVVIQSHSGRAGMRESGFFGPKALITGKEMAAALASDKSRPDAVILDGCGTAPIAQIINAESGVPAAGTTAGVGVRASEGATAAMVGDLAGGAILEEATTDANAYLHAHPVKCEGGSCTGEFVAYDQEPEPPL